MDSALTTVGLPLALAIIMFGLGLDLTPADFRRVGRAPRAVAVALSIGLLLLVQLASEWVPGLGWAGELDLEHVGFGLVALFVLVWGSSVAWYHLAHVEDRFEEKLEKGLA